MSAEYATATPRDVAATWALHRYAFSAAAAIAGPWYLDRRVPVLSLRQIAFEPDERRLSVAGIDMCYCLASDTAANEPSMVVLPDADALAAQLRATVADHLAPFLHAFRSEMRRGDRMLWAMAADELVHSIWHIGRILDVERDAVAAANRLLPAAAAPYPGCAGFTETEQGWHRTRLGCCLYYRIRPDDMCQGCPRKRRRGEDAGLLSIQRTG